MIFHNESRKDKVHTDFYLVTQDSEYELFAFYKDSQHLLRATHRITKGSKISELVEMFDFKSRYQFYKDFIKIIFTATKIKSQR